MTKINKRLNKIIQIIQENNGASVKDLAFTLEVSEMTIRRDLKKLNEKNIVKNYYGSAIYNSENTNPLLSKSTNSSEYNIFINSSKNETAKDKIGKMAATMINDGDVVFIDNGTTTEKLCKYVDEQSSFNAIILSSNNLNHLITKKNVQITLAGGNFHRDTGTFISSEGELLLKGVRASKVFLSAAGIHDKLGITCEYNYEVEAKKIIIENAVEKILLIDSSKFDKVKPAFIGDLKDINTIITDKEITDEWKEILKSHNIEYVCV